MAIGKQCYVALSGKAAIVVGTEDRNVNGQWAWGEFYFVHADIEPLRVVGGRRQAGRRNGPFPGEVLENGGAEK